MRAPAVVAACMVELWCAHASADQIDSNVRSLSSSSGATDRVRLAAVLALAKSRDPRAVIAVSGALTHDDDPTVRRVAALALEKMIDATTAADARALAFAALDAAVNDADLKVREAADRTAKMISGERNRSASSARASGGAAANGISVFVHVDAITDQTKKLASESSARLHDVVRKTVERTGYATQWPSGGVPTQAELGPARGFIVASTVKTLDITRAGNQTTIACTLAIRVAPWAGRDGGEHWEANKAASASGSAKATTGNGAREVESGVRDCIEAVGEDVTNRQVVPFLKKLASS